MNSLEILKTATGLIPSFNGREDEAEAMLVALETLKEAVDEQHHHLIMRIVQSKLKGQGRKIVGKLVNSIDDILIRINAYFKDILPKCSRPSHQIQ